MNDREILRELAGIDEMVALRDKLARETTPKGRWMAAMLSETIVLIRGRILSATVDARKVPVLVSEGASCRQA